MTKSFRPSRFGRAHRALVGAVALATAEPATASADENAADRHFKQGLDLARAQEFQAAVEQFERAHALSPHFAVLYNLGQAYALAGRPVEAHAVLTRYLSEGGEAVSAKRREQAEATIAQCLSKTGTLKFQIEPANAEIWLDGRTLASSARELRVTAASHAVLVQAPGHLPRSGVVEVPGGGEATLSWTLATVPAPPAWLEPRCNVPNVTVTIDGKPAGSAPLFEPIRVEAGERRIGFARAGYVGRTVTLEAPPGARLALDCDLRIDPTALRTSSSRLRVTVSEPQARVFVNGVPFTGQPVPPGAHHIEVLKNAFEPWSRALTLTPGEARQVEVTLRPSPAYASEYRERAERQRTIALTGLGIGVVLSGVAAALHAHSAQLFDTWQADRKKLDADLLDGSVGPSEVERSREINQRAAGIQALDDAVVFTAIIGGALALVSAGAWAFGPDPDRYEPKPSRAMARNSLTWTF